MYVHSYHLPGEFCIIQPSCGASQSVLNECICVQSGSFRQCITPVRKRELSPVAKMLVEGHKLIDCSILSCHSVSQVGWVS